MDVAVHVGIVGIPSLASAVLPYCKHIQGQHLVASIVNISHHYQARAAARGAPKGRQVSSSIRRPC